MTTENVATYLGKHLILDLWVHEDYINFLYSVEDIEEMLKDAALAANAKILSSDFHSFGEGEGITGVLVLAESHISIHTWPEYGYAAIDIFLCGKLDPEKAVKSIIGYAPWEITKSQMIYRGISERC